MIGRHSISHIFALAISFALPGLSIQPTRLVYEYPHVGTWIENMAVRSNGSILLTSIGKPGGLSSLDPFSSSPPTQLASAASFGYRNATLGIAEPSPDKFYVLTNNFSLEPGFVGWVSGTSAVYKVDFTHKPTPSISLLADYPQIESFNGLTKFNETLLLAADSVGGKVWGVNVETKHASVVADDQAFKPVEASDGQVEGINGVHFSNGTLYFTNSQMLSFGKLELDKNAKPSGPVTVLTHSKTEKGVMIEWDDFALDKDNKYAYVATESGNSVQRVDLSTGNVTVFAGNVNSTDIAEPTSTIFGRTIQDLNILYVSTAGGLAFPVQYNGPKQSGAQIVAADLNSMPQRYG